MEATGIMQSSSPKWKRPEEMMYHRLKQKKRALSARINGNDNLANMSFYCSSNSGDSIELPAAKRRNPFLKRVNESNTKLSDPISPYESGIETDMSSDTTLFQLLGSPHGSRTAKEAPKSFANILQHLNKNEEVQPVKQESPKKIIHKDGSHVPIDWSIKTKVRLMSKTPFTWTGTLKTCEQASSITGFVRCLETTHIKEHNTSCTLDTSPNARFHQCCLYWQHPNIPWLQLFPKNGSKSNPAMISAQLQMAPILLSEWTTSFKSLFQLVRTSQCPFFYVIANHFTCLFQAAGVAGINQTHALVNPTTRGFRKMLDDEGVTYTMPLRRKRKSSEFTNDSDSSQLTINGGEISGEEDFEDEEDWMESLGIDAKEIKKMAASQKAIERSKEGKIDGTNESLVLIQGVDVQAFFNVLLNCKSCVASTGPFAGIPPTLISPTAFSLATLKSCQVSDRVLDVDCNKYCSILIEGPILPHSFRQICHLLDEYKNDYTVNLLPWKSSLGFTQAFKNIEINVKNDSSFSTVFLKENLSDCGLPQKMISVFCDDDREKYDIIEKVEPKSKV